MNGKRTNNNLLLLLVGVIALLATSLGFIQLRWLDAFTKINEQRLRTSLNIGTIQVINSARIEASILFSILNLTGGEVEERDFSRFARDLDIWGASTDFDDLIDAVFLLEAADSSSGVLTVSRWMTEEETFSAIPTPLLMDELISALNRGDKTAFDEIESLMHDGGIYLMRLPVPAPLPKGADGEDLPAPPLLIVDVDEHVLYKKIIPHYMEKNLPEYPFSITDNDTGKVILKRGEFTPHHKPELTLPLHRSFYNPLSRELPLPPEFQGVVGMTSNLLLRVWSSLNRETRNTLIDRSPQYSLSVYYPGGTLSGQMRTREILDLIVILGFPILFVSTLFLLYFLFRRSQQMRLREQNFVSSMSHELRTPIAVIQATSDTLERNIVKTPERIALYGSIISKQAKRLSESVEGILMYSGMVNRMETPGRADRHDLSQMTEEIGETMGLLVKEKGARLVMEITHGITASVDSEAVRLILENLLSNGVKHGLNPQGPGAPPGEITLRLHRDTAGDTAILSVTDRGPGISSYDRKRLFQPFYRGRRTRANQCPGSGLGLHLVSRTVDLIGGTIHVQSPCFPEEPKTRRGSRFTVLLPCQKEAE